MSAAPSPARPETPVTPLRPALALTPEEEKLLARKEEKAMARARLAMRARRVVLGMSVFAVVVPPLAVLAGQSLPDDGVGIVLVLCWALLIPPAGLALIAFAVLRRTARDMATLMVAILSLIASILLLEPAGAAGSAVMLDRHAAALEEIARDLAKAPSEVQAEVATGFAHSGTDSPTEATRRAAEGILARLHDEGFASASVGGEHVAFQRRAPFGWNAVYLASGRGGDPAALRWTLECEGLRTRRAGGDWYLYRCAGDGF